MTRPAGGSAAHLELRELSTVEELRPLEALQRSVWGVDDLEIVPATAMAAATHAGGLVVGAFIGHELVGFAYGFVATPHGRGMAGTGLHSHMAAVSARHRSVGVGRSLKRYQAEWCRRRGLRWISWTFDPLLAKNARFNLEILGARAYEYLVDVYGPMPGRLGGGIASDRLLALWSLDDETSATTEARTKERTPVADDQDEDRWVLRRGPDNEPLENGSRPASDGSSPANHGSRPASDGSSPASIGYGQESSAGHVRVATPAEDRTLFEDPDKAMAWRQAHRRTLAALLQKGYAVTGFEGGAYSLSPVLPVIGRPEQANPQRL